MTRAWPRSASSGAAAAAALLVLGLLAGLCNGQRDSTHYAILAVTYRATAGAVPSRHVMADLSYFSLYSSIAPVTGRPVVSMAGSSTLVTGCSPFTPASPPPATWVAVVMRGGCSFAEKSVHAIAAGAAAVVVVDNVPGEVPPIMAASAESLATLADVSLIPAVSVTITTGQQLVTILSKDPAAVLELVVGPPADTSNEESDEKKRAWFLGHIVIFVGTLSAIGLLVVFTFYCRGGRGQARAEAEERQETEAVVKRLPTRLFILDQMLEDNERPACAVCLDDFEMDDELRILACKHEFHRQCVDPWLFEHHTCPLCKSDILEIAYANPDPTSMANSSSMGSSGSRPGSAVRSLPGSALGGDSSSSGAASPAARDGPEHLELQTIDPAQALRASPVNFLPLPPPGARVSSRPGTPTNIMLPLHVHGSQRTELVALTIPDNFASSGTAALAARAPAPTRDAVIVVPVPRFPAVASTQGTRA